MDCGHRPWATESQRVSGQNYGVRLESVSPPPSFYSWSRKSGSFTAAAESEGGPELQHLPWHPLHGRPVEAFSVPYPGSSVDPTPNPLALSLLSPLLDLRRPARLSSLRLHPTFRPEPSGLLACSCARGPSWACTCQALSAHCSAKDPSVPGAPGSQALGVTVPAPDPMGGPATGGNHVHEEPLTFR